MAHLRLVPAAAPQGLEIRASVALPVLHVSVSGELDIATAHRLQAPELLVHDEERVTAVALELGRLVFCDLTGLRALVRYRDAQADLRRVVLARNVRPNVLTVMRVAGVDRLFGA